MPARNWRHSIPIADYFQDKAFHVLVMMMMMMMMGMRYPEAMHEA